MLGYCFNSTVVYFLGINIYFVNETERESLNRFRSADFESFFYVKLYTCFKITSRFISGGKNNHLTKNPSETM